jgi:hypothetical protein
LDQRTGAFTNALCECLRNSHHNTSILSLYKDICIYLLENGYNQIPILSTTVESPTHIICKKMPTFRHQYRHIKGCPESLIPINKSVGTLDLFANSEISVITNDDMEEITRGFLPIFGSSSQINSVSTISNGTLSRLGRHYYRKLTNSPS